MEAGLGSMCNVTVCDKIYTYSVYNTCINLETVLTLIIVIECGPPPEVMGCELTLPHSTTNCGSEVEYRPQKGFTLDGDDMITCTVDGEWSGDMGFTECQSEFVEYYLNICPSLGTIYPSL